MRAIFIGGFLVGGFRGRVCGKCMLAPGCRANLGRLCAVAYRRRSFISLPVQTDLPGILFGDERFVVLDKPAGLPVHAGPSGGRSVEDWFPLLSRRKDGPWLAHRLDADTSGCLLIALRRAALVAAQGLFAAGAVRKTYWAVVAGVVEADRGRVSAPLRRVSDRSGWRMVVDAATGQGAVTDWRVLGRGDGRTWLELQPRTGRTHQVRVHCATIGSAILGDARYGEAGAGLHLLARAIHVPLVPPVDATADPPSHMLRALERCGFHS
jgi:tRNA pseudouridine32 synthase / 23S rRNA pseudouridine746 synthase